MQWNEKDVLQYAEVSEYVDTLLIPLMPFSLKNEKEVAKAPFQGELLKIFTYELERQFKGRMFLMPFYNYLSTTSKGKEVERLNEWVAHVQEYPFKHVFFLTFDSHWKKHESQLGGTLLWFPAMQHSDLKSNETQQFVKNQVDQVTDLIRSFW